MCLYAIQQEEQQNLFVTAINNVREEKREIVTIGMQGPKQLEKEE